MIRMRRGKKRNIALAAVTMYMAVATCFIPNANASLPIEVSVGSNSSIPTQLKEASQTPFTEIALQADDRTLVYEEVEDLYVVTNPQDTAFLKVIEKLPEGGMGRLLRFRGFAASGNWVDLEFIYQDREKTLTVLDYAAGRFYRSTFRGPAPNPSSVLPSKDAKDLTVSLTAVPVNPNKFLIPVGTHFEQIAPPVSWYHPRFRVLSEQEVWSSRLVRGPPLGEALP